MHVEVAQRQLQHVELAVDLALPRVPRQRAQVVDELARLAPFPRALQHARGRGPLHHAVVRGGGLPAAQRALQQPVAEVQARARGHGHVDLALAREVGPAQDEVVLGLVLPAAHGLGDAPLLRDPLLDAPHPAAERRGGAPPLPPRERLRDLGLPHLAHVLVAHDERDRARHLPPAVEAVAHRRALVF